MVIFDQCFQASSQTKADLMSVVTGSGEELDRLRKVLVEAIDEEKTRTQRERKFLMIIQYLIQ